MSATPETTDGKPQAAEAPAAGETPAASDSTAPGQAPAANGGKPKRTDRKPGPEAERWLIQNQSARRIAINKRDGGEGLLLAPLEERSIDAKDLDELDTDKWEQSNVVRCEAPEERTTTNVEPFIQPFMGLVTGWVVVGLILGGKPEMWTLLLRVANLEITPISLYWFGIPIIALAIIGIVAWRSSKKKYILQRLLAHFIGLLFIFLIAVGLPFFGIYKFGGGQDLFTSDSPPLLQLGRWLQLLFITVASLLPALLYYLFDRQQLATLQEKFWRDILRLDPYVKTLSEVKAKYGKQISEIYGSDRATGAGRLLADTRWPIPVATLVITLGWFMTFLPARSAIELTQPSDLYKLLTPQSTAIAFGFLGAYLYGLNLVLRRYVLGDLRPKTYTNITVRLLAVFILAWLLSALSPDYAVAHTIVLAFSFFAGIVPETVLTYFQERYKSVGIARGAQLKEKQPLTKLEGIDLYDRARLMDEGVTNIENLAHHDIVDLMLQTRIPTQRIVDWVDQSILYLHLGGDECADRCIERLRGYGVRTATCLRKACEDEKNLEHLSGVFQTLYCGGRVEPQDGDERDGVEEETDEAADAPADVPTPHRLPIILTALEDAEWLEYIQYWRDYRLRDQQTVVEPEEIFAADGGAGGRAVSLPPPEGSREQSPNGVGEPI